MLDIYQNRHYVIEVTAVNGEKEFYTTKGVYPEDLCDGTLSKETCEKLYELRS